MACCSLLGEVVAASVTKTENVAEVTLSATQYLWHLAMKVRLRVKEEWMVPQMKRPPTMRTHEHTVSVLLLLPLAALRKWQRKGIFWMAKREQQGQKWCQSRMMMRLWCSRNYSSQVCAGLCIPH
jgi:hypothetical protein